MAGLWAERGVSTPIDVILLAGDRGPDDPLAQAAGVPGKALVPVAGCALLTRVVTVLSEWPRLGRLIVVAPDHADYRSAVEQANVGQSVALGWVRPRGSLSDSVRTGMEVAQSAIRVVLTADHALLDRAWLDELLLAAEERPQAQVLVGVTEWVAVMARFPGSRRTRYRFSDHSICGTNLFALRAQGADRLLNVWLGVERQRKRPWRIVSLLGWRNLAAYLAGRLGLEAAFGALSRRVGIEIIPVRISDPLSAVDVDTRADLELVESVLADKDRTVC